MGLIFLVGLGAILGWLATIIRQTRTSHGAKVNVAAGVAGALLTGVLVNPLIGEDSIVAGRVSAEALLLSMLGSLVLIVSVNFLHHRELH